LGAKIRNQLNNVPVNEVHHPFLSDLSDQENITFSYINDKINMKNLIGIFQVRKFLINLPRF